MSSWVVFGNWSRTVFIVSCVDVPRVHSVNFLSSVPLGFQHNVDWECVDGTVQEYVYFDSYSNNLGHCAPGSFSSTGLEPCSLCAIGAYQNSNQSTSCIACQNGFTTFAQGSHLASLCRRPCNVGYFSSSTGLEPCEACSIGSYQNTSQSFSCVTCPVGFNTSAIGSNSSSLCLLKCTPGHYSSTGFSPCTACARAYYQPIDQMTSCNACLINKNTTSTGSISESNCTYPCSPGYFSETGYGLCDACPRGTYQSANGSTSCESCPGGNSTEFVATNSSSLCSSALFVDFLM